jgi:cytochrome c5
MTESPAPLVADPVVPSASEPAPAAAAPATPPAPSATAKPTPAAPQPTPAPAPAAVPTDVAKGQQIYRQACAFCHDKGAAGAPKIGDKPVWAPRIAQGMDVLYTSSIRGKGAMPAKGGNPSLADTDVKAAVDYLVAQSR